MNIGLHASFLIIVFSGYMPQSEITGSYGNIVCSFFLKNFHTLLHSGCTDLHVHWQQKSVPFSPYPLQHLLYVVFLMMGILTSVRWYLILVLICIYLINSHVEHFSTYLLAISMSYLKRYLFSSSALFFLNLYVKLYELFLYVWKLSPC